MSSIGYASSKDGKKIDERLKKPIYTPHYWFECNDDDYDRAGISPMFSSGGDWGGCEDPKVTQIGDRIYMTYVAFNGTWPTRTVLTSISVDDFLNKKCSSRTYTRGSIKEQNKQSFLINELLTVS
jgi:predicted GH43/DUF377 family glycosyl hydrolase